MTSRTRDIRGSAAQRRAVWGVVEENTGDPLLMEWAALFLRAYNVPERDPRALARAIQRYSQQHIKFMRERPERFVKPTRTIKWGFGDCDDKSILIATILRSFRVPVRLAFIRFEVRKPNGRSKKISHVYPEVFLDGRWEALESVHPWELGDSPQQRARAKGLSPMVAVIGPT